MMMVMILAAPGMMFPNDHVLVSIGEKCRGILNAKTTSLSHVVVEIAGAAMARRIR